MKYLVSGMLLGLLLATSHVSLADSPAITFTKIKYIAENCGSVNGFAAWLRTKKGISEVDDRSYIYLTSYPAKYDIHFKLNDKPMRIRVSPIMSFKTIKTAYRAQDKSRPMTQKSSHTEQEFSPDQILQVEDILQILAEQRARIDEEVRILDFLLKDYEASNSRINLRK